MAHSAHVTASLVVGEDLHTSTSSISFEPFVSQPERSFNILQADSCLLRDVSSESNSTIASLISCFVLHERRPSRRRLQGSPIMAAVYEYISGLDTSTTSSSLASELPSATDLPTSPTSFSNMHSKVGTVRSAVQVLLGSAQLFLSSSRPGALVQAGTPPSCPNAELSCNNATAVSNICCFNAPGGQLLLTQFWDTHPVVGPSDSWTIHGLWCIPYIFSYLYISIHSRRTHITVNQY